MSGAGGAGRGRAIGTPAPRAEGGARGKRVREEGGLREAAGGILILHPPPASCGLQEALLQEKV